jgi:hypothetical protein
MRRDSRGKRPAFYDHPAHDQMMSMILVLASEMSVVSDHIDSLERVISANGIDVAAGLAALKLDQDALEARETRRQQLLERLFYLMRKEATEAGAGETAPGYLQVIDEIALP